MTICGNDVAMICRRGALWTLHVGTNDGQRFELARHGVPGTARFATLGDALSALDARWMTSGPSVRSPSPPTLDPERPAGFAFALPLRSP